MRTPSYETLLKRFLAGVEKTKHMDYSDMKTVRANNRGVDQYRKAATQIGELYPERIDDFASMLNSDDFILKRCVAVCMVELMPCSEKHRSQAFEFFIEHYNTETDELEKAMIMMWLKKMKYKG